MRHLTLIVSTFILVHTSFSFAAIPPVLLPQTGQTTCYDTSGAKIACTGTGQDGELQMGVAWPSLRFIDNGNGSVSDKLSGLMWSTNANAPGPAVCGPGASKNWQGALDYTACLNNNSYLGYTDWRLPSIREIGGLVSFSSSSSFLPTDHPFTSVQEEDYWSSSSGSKFPTQNAWGIMTSGGFPLTTTITKSEAHYVWPVRSWQTTVPAPIPKTGQTTSYGARDDGALKSGVLWPSPRFTDNGDGSVADNLTGLTWLKDAGCIGSNDWKNALIKANTLSKGTCGLMDSSEPGDWHLPNINELTSLHDYSKADPSLPSGHPFISVASNNYFTSSSLPRQNSSIAYSSTFYSMYDSGGSSFYYKTSAGSVWPVRSGQYQPLGSLILFSPRADIGNVFVGIASTANQVRLRNSGADAITVSAISMSGADSSQFLVVPGGFNPCVSLTPTIEAGAVCTVIISAVPTTSGSKIANLTITTTAGSVNISQTATAYSTVHGTVTDQSIGLPVSGATVTLNTSLKTTTDDFGNYNFGDLPVATYSVNVSKTGYQSVSKSGLAVSATASANSNILLPTVGTFNITSSMLPSATVGEEYSSRVLVSGGVAPYTFSKAYGSLPSGVSLNTSTGSITGTPTGAGSFTFAIGVSDSAAGYSEKEFTIDLVPSLQITTTSLPRGTKGSDYSYSATINVSGGKPGYSFAVPFSSLNPILYATWNLNLNTSSGQITGICGDNFTRNFTISVSDSTSRTVSKQFVIEIDEPLLITTSAIGTGIPATAYSQSILATGGYGAYTWSVTSGVLPSGISLNSSTGVISGQTTNTGSFTINITVQDAVGRTATKSYSLKMSPLLALTTTALSAGYVGAAYNENLHTTGGIAPLVFSYSGSLPTGLFLMTSTGTISGSPSVAGLTNVSFTVTDSSYPTPIVVTQTVALRIWNALSISTNSIPTGTQKSTFNTSLSGVGGAIPHSWSIITGTLPQGLTLDSTTGTIAGTPTICGSFPLTARLTDSATTPKSVDKSLFINIACTNDYIISGNVGVAGATVSYSGTASGSVTADGGGNYSIGPLLNGTYTVTPTKPLYIFTPTSRSVIVNNLDVSVATFTGAVDITAPTITGFVIPSTATALAVPVTTFTATDNVAVTGYLITETATTPTAADTDWSATAQTSHTFAGIPVGIATAKTLYAWAKDAAGNISANSTATSTITLPDVIKPEVTVFTIPATSNSLTVAVSTFTATDNTTVTGYLLSETSSQPQASNPGWSATLPTQYVFSSQGTRTLYAFAKDAAGNISVPLSAMVTITLADTTAPIVTTFTIPATATILTIPITTFTATDSVGVSGYLLSETGAQPQSNDSGWSVSEPTQFVFSSQGTKTLYAFAKDDAGNISAPLSATATITLPDTTSPVVSQFTIPASATSLTVSITALTATDAVGVTRYLVIESATVPQGNAPGWLVTAPSQYVFTSQGAKTLYVFAKDAAGNISVPLSATVNITLADTTAPVVTAFTIPATATNLTVPVSSFSATDDVGITGYYLSEAATAPSLSDPLWTVMPTSSYTFATGGAKTLYAFAKDTAGNISAPISDTISITLADTAAPTVTVFTMPTTAASLTVPVTTFTANDNTAVTGYILSEVATAPSPAATGWTSTPPNAYTFGSAGIKTLYAFAKDAAGNISAPLTAGIAITLADTAAPTISTFVIPATSASLSVPITTFTATDNVAVSGYLLSEVSASPLPAAIGWTSTAPGSFAFSTAGSKNLYAFAKDAAGNVSPPASDSVVITLSVVSTQFAVTPNTGSGYTITPAIAQTINNNVTTSFNVIPAAGYGIASVSGCGGSLSGSTYTTGAITADCTVSVTAVARNANNGSTLQPTITDALKVLQAVVGTTPLTATDKIRYDVAPLASNGTPVGNGIIDSADVILILRRSIGIGSW